MSWNLTGTKRIGIESTMIGIILSQPTALLTGSQKIYCPLLFVIFPRIIKNVGHFTKAVLMN